MASSGAAVDLITVFEALRECEQDEETGGLGYLNRLAESVPAARNARRPIRPIPLIPTRIGSSFLFNDSIIIEVYGRCMTDL